MNIFYDSELQKNNFLKMWPFDLFNVILAMVSNAFCESDVDEELYSVTASITMSTYFSELIREKVVEAVDQLKEWQQEGTFRENVMKIVYDYFEPVENQDVDPAPEEQIKQHLIGLGIIHHWTTSKEDLSVYEEKIEELENILAHDIKTKSQEENLQEKLTTMMEKFKL